MVRNPRVSRRMIEGYLFILPAVLVIAAFALYPALRVAVDSVTAGELSGRAGTFVGLQNYQTVLSERVFRTAIVNSVVFATAAVILHIVLGLGLGLLFSGVGSERYERIASALLMLPWTIPPVVAAIIWRLLYQPALSPYPALLSGLGVKVDWNFLANPDRAMWAVLAAYVWASAPFYFLMLMASLKAIPQSTIEASFIDGASRWQQLKHIVLPQLRNPILTMAVVSLLFSFTIYDTVWIMTGGGPLNTTEVMATNIYRTAFGNSHFELASAMGGVMVAMMMVVIAALFALMDRD